MEVQRKFGVTTSVTMPMIKAGVIDFAASGDWTPVNGDVLISKNEATAVNIATLPVIIDNMNAWKFAFSAAELQARRITVTIVDSATKTVEDSAIVITTYGHASAEHVETINDFRDSILSDSTAFPGANVDVAASAIKAKTDSLTFSTALQLDANMVAISSDGTAADNLELFVEGTELGTTPKVDVQHIRSVGEAASNLMSWMRAGGNGTAQAGSTNTITLASSETSTNNAAKSMLVCLASGTAANQARIIVAYDGASKVATVSPDWEVIPDNTTKYATVPFGQGDLGMIRGDLAAATSFQKALASSPSGTVDHSAFTATTSIFESDDITTATSDHWNPRIILFTSGALDGFVADISDYALSGSNGRFTVSPVMPSAPADNVTFVIL